MHMPNPGVIDQWPALMHVLPLLDAQPRDPIEMRIAGRERHTVLDGDSGNPEIIVWYSAAHTLQFLLDAP